MGEAPEQRETQPASDPGKAKPHGLHNLEKIMPQNDSCEQFCSQISSGIDGLNLPFVGLLRSGHSGQSQDQQEPHLLVEVEVTGCFHQPTLHLYPISYQYP